MIVSCPAATPAVGAIYDRHAQTCALSACSFIDSSLTGLRASMTADGRIRRGEAGQAGLGEDAVRGCAETNAASGAAGRLTTDGATTPLPTRQRSRKSRSGERCSRACCRRQRLWPCASGRPGPGAIAAAIGDTSPGDSTRPPAQHLHDDVAKYRQAERREVSTSHYSRIIPEKPLPRFARDRVRGPYGGWQPEKRTVRGSTARFRRSPPPRIRVIGQAEPTQCACAGTSRALELYTSLAPEPLRRRLNDERRRTSTSLDRQGTASLSRAARRCRAVLIKSRGGGRRSRRSWWIREPPTSTDARRRRRVRRTRTSPVLGRRSRRSRRSLSSIAWDRRGRRPALVRVRTRTSSGRWCGEWLRWPRLAAAS